MKRIIISDLHLGSAYCKEEELLQFLNGLECDEIILAGDIVDFVKIPVFSEQSLDILHKITSFPRVVYIIGNHDYILLKIVSICQDWLERTFSVDLATWWANRALAKRKLIRLWDIIDFNKDVDVTIMGHSHRPEVVIWVDEMEKIKTYANIGDWVEHSTYIMIRDRQLRLKTFEPKEI